MNREAKECSLAQFISLWSKNVFDGWQFVWSIANLIGVEYICANTASDSGIYYVQREVYFIYFSNFISPLKCLFILLLKQLYRNIGLHHAAVVQKQVWKLVFYL